MPPSKGFKMRRTICVVAGKSGGHIIPGLSYAQKMLKSDPDQDLLFFSTHSPLDKKLLQGNKLVTDYVPLTLGNIPYKKFYKFPLFFAQLGYSFIKSFFGCSKNALLLLLAWVATYQYLYALLRVCYVSELNCLNSILHQEKQLLF